MSGWDLTQGDSLRLLSTLSPECADLVLTDPPYGISYQATAGRRKSRPILNDERPFIWWLHDAARVLKPTGALVCFCRWDVQEAFRVAVHCAGLEIRSQLVWDRMQRGQGALDRDPAPRHDVAWFAVKGDFRFHGRRVESVIPVLKPQWRDLTHPTEKPLALMLELVETLCPPGGLVLDPFAGSGASGEACVKLGRRWWGCELDGAYYATARRRLEAAAPLFLGGGEQGDLLEGR